MSAFAGLVRFDGGPVDNQSEDRLGRAITALRKGRLHAQRLDNALFVQRNATPASNGNGNRQPFTGKNEHALFVADARLDNREELRGALGMAPPELARTSDSELLRRVFERWGDAGIARCLGAFVFAYWDASARRLILGRDCLGNRALFFHRGHGCVAFATTLNAMLALPDVPRAIDEIALANFLAVNLCEARRTFYRGIERVPSRMTVTLDRDGIEHRHYWAPDLDAPPPFRRDEDYVERARELFDQAVATATADTAHVAISASGGLDSSAIAATAARLGRARHISCYTLVPPVGTDIDVGPYRYLDERDKMTALARMYPTLDLKYMAPEELHPIDEDATRHFARMALPAYGPIHMGVYNFLCDAVAVAGHRALLNGGMGNFGLSWPGRLSLLALLRGGQWNAFIHELAAVAGESNHGLARTLAADLATNGVPPFLRRVFYRLRGRDPGSVARYSALNPAFIAEHSLRQLWHAQGFDPWFGMSGWNAARLRARYMFDHNQYGRDGKGMCEERHGFEWRDPHADRRLLEFALTVPEPVYRRNGVPRSFARAVFADRLPREILDERRRGANTVTWFSRLDARRQDIAGEIERLEGSPLARQLLDLPRLKCLMEQWPADENAAEKRIQEYRLALSRGVHVGNFIRWVEGGNA
jgi:asparagine synthase (glutamine-hydrolysing)